MAHIRLIATGGTIASTETEAGGPVTAALAGERLLAALSQGSPKGVTVSVEDFKALGSYALDLPTVHALCLRIDAVLADPMVDGVVVTHGTDTMEESAWLADLLVTSDKPVVFTGAQRHAGEPDSDGPRNIADALSCAASPALVGLGAVILFEGDIHAAREVTKTHSARTDTFRSPGLGKIGEVDRGEVHLYRTPRSGLRLSTECLEDRVDLLLLGLGMGADLLDLLADRGARGIVLAAFGRGNAPQGFAEGVARLRERGVLVVVCSRCPEGRTAGVYGGDSGATTLVEAGAILGGDFSPIKARLLLSALLGAGADKDRITQVFAGP
ncbi:asparaginase [Rhodospirillum sp. A1_3_36]|uniref:asparaginase n=1 Tax=Rhodospirillum sp. A1_3_36 TaxID=3391666 RepID=UPI0039A6A5FC